MEDKSYEFISKAEVPVPSGSDGYQVLSAVGVVCLVIALVCELLLKNVFVVVLVVPLIYLIHLRRQMCSRRRSVDIRTRLVLYGDRVEATYYVGLITPNGLLTKQYIIPRSTVRNMVCWPDQNLLELVFDGEIRIFGIDGEQIRSQVVRQERLPLHLPSEAYVSVCAMLKG
jgi:hypothetical protein